jgi:hypothetical protein
MNSNKYYIYADYGYYPSRFGDLKERQPVTTTRLKLNATLKIRKEMMALICANMI